MGGSLFTVDGGQSWSIVSERPIQAARLRVDRHPPISATCRGALDSCQITGPAAAALTRQLRGGTTLAAQLVGVRSILDNDVSLAGADQLWQVTAPFR
ncbi:hypothetical protein [Sabulicella glaciei]|uniref:Uncharacterized protein n=1 Tax=Sabulicella glaciei TaxID=2984948 RepID=A0ABT3NZF3_9PROT|nr:hypothetical protein [Roseococcus sp. MDT2-1-1]MCW8087544.1 hypothetical protein [Roseococcus sp. MDT2-1-1]